MLVFSVTLTTLLTALLGPLVSAQICEFGTKEDLTISENAQAGDTVVLDDTGTFIGRFLLAIYVRSDSWEGTY